LMLAVVLAAGRGKRLHPLTDRRSKGMLPVVGKPMIERVLDMAAQGGADRFVVVVHPEDGALMEHLGRCSGEDRLRWAYQARRWGMAHALECAVPLIREDGGAEFLLASCDNLYPDGHVAALVHGRREADLDATLTLLRVRPEQIPTLAVVALQGDRVTDLVEKPRPEEAPSDWGVPALYALSTRVLDYLPQVPVSVRGERDFPDALRLLIAAGGRVGGVPVPWRLTLTNPADLLALNRHILRRDPTRVTVPVGLPADVEVLPPVDIEAGVSLGSGCRIGPEVYLEAGAGIGAGAVVRRAVVLQDGRVPAGTVVADGVVG